MFLDVNTLWNHRLSVLYYSHCRRKMYHYIHTLTEVLTTKMSTEALSSFAGLLAFLFGVVVGSVLSTQARLLGNREPLLDDSSIRLACKQVCGAYSWLMIDVGRYSLPGQCHLWTGSPSSPGLYKKTAEQAMESQPVSSIPLVSASESLPWFSDRLWSGFVSQINKPLPSLNHFQVWCFSSRVK